MEYAVFRRSRTALESSTIHPHRPRSSPHTQPLPARRDGRILRCSQHHPQPSGAAGEARTDMTAPAREKKARQQPRVSVRPEAVWTAGSYAVLATLCVLCYSNSVRGELVHDDVWAIINNPDVRPSSSLRNIFSNDFWGKRMSDNTSHKSYRPLCILTFK